MNAQPQPERQQSETLVERAQRVMNESKELLERREAQARQIDHFVARATQNLIDLTECAAAFDSPLLKTRTRLANDTLYRLTKP